MFNLCECVDMLYLFELHYQIQKDIYFTGKVANQNYNIYYNQIIPEMYWNYGTISNLLSVKNTLPDFVTEFKNIGRVPCIFVNSQNTKLFSEAIEQKFRVNFSESWLRYDNQLPTSDLRAKVVETEEDKDAFTKLFAQNFSEKNAYLEKITSDYLNLVRLSLSASHTKSFIVYEDELPVAAATIGSNNDYYMIFNLTTSHKNVNDKHREAIINSCIEYFSENSGRSLLVKISNDRLLEKLFCNLGFTQIAFGHRMSF